MDAVVLPPVPHCLVILCLLACCLQPLFVFLRNKKIVSNMRNKKVVHIVLCLLGDEVPNVGPRAACYIHATLSHFLSFLIWTHIWTDRSGKALYICSVRPAHMNQEKWESVAYIVWGPVLLISYFVVWFCLLIGFVRLISYKLKSCFITSNLYQSPWKKINWTRLKWVFSIDLRCLDCMDG